MRAREFVRLAALLGAALAGGALAQGLGLPAGWMLGATAASLVMATLGHDANPPAWLRDAAFLVLGVMLGSSVDERTLQEAARWPASFLILAVSVVAMMALARGFCAGASATTPIRRGWLRRRGRCRR